MFYFRGLRQRCSTACAVLRTIDRLQKGFLDSQFLGSNQAVVWPGYPGTRNTVSIFVLPKDLFSEQLPMTSTPWHGLTSVVMLVLSLVGTSTCQCVHNPADGVRMHSVLLVFRVYQSYD
eukprot:1615160-Rhodomonas_salina.2